jgi:hypothetical protein
MRPPEDEGTSDSDGAAERLRQHLESRLPPDEVHDILEDLQLESPTKTPVDEEAADSGASPENDKQV